MNNKSINAVLFVFVKLSTFHQKSRICIKNMLRNFLNGTEYQSNHHQITDIRFKLQPWLPVVVGNLIEKCLRLVTQKALFCNIIVIDQIGNIAKF